MKLYAEKSSYPKYNAQSNLEGKTHYVDDNTLRGFHARILETHICDGGLIFALVESVALDPDNRRRGFRPVVFDVFGTVIDRPKLADAYSTKRAAVKALWKIVNALDAEQITRAGIEREKRAFEREMLDNETKLAELIEKNMISKPITE